MRLEGLQDGYTGIVLREEHWVELYDKKSVHPKEAKSQLELKIDVASRARPRQTCIKTSE